MCRLFGWAGTGDYTLADLLGEDISRVADLSHLHQDGWGGAWQSPEELVVIREDRPAYSSESFRNAVTGPHAATGLLHLRWATDAIPRCLENTHPFVRDHVAFAHNGSLPRGPQLDALIDADLLETVEGDGDSERYFLALLTARRRTGSVVEAFREVLAALEGQPWPSLNALWVEPGVLYALCAHQPQYRNPDVDADYYALHHESAAGLTTVWSTGVRARAGNVVPNRCLVLARAGSDSAELVPL